MALTTALPVISVVDNNSYLPTFQGWTTYVSIPGASFTPNHRYLVFVTTECYAGYYATAIYMRNKFNGTILEGSSNPTWDGGDSTRRQFVMSWLVTAPPTTGTGFEFQAGRQGGVTGNNEYIYRTRILAIDVDVNPTIFPNSEKGWLYAPVAYFGLIAPDTTFQSAVSLTFNGDGSDYLIIATGTAIGGGNPYKSEFRLYHDVAGDTDYPLTDVYAEPSYSSFACDPTVTVARVFSALSGSHTFSYQMRRTNGNSGPGAMADARVIAIRLKSFTSRAVDYYNPGGVATKYADTSVHNYRTTPATDLPVTAGDNMLIFRCLESALYGTATSGYYTNQLIQLPSTSVDILYTLAGLQQVGYYPYDNIDEKKSDFAVAYTTAGNTTPQFAAAVNGNTANYPSFYRSVLVALKAEVTATISQHTSDSYLVNRIDKVHTTDSLLQKTQSRTHTSDCLLVPTPKTHTSDALIVSVGYRQHTTDTLLSAPTQKEHTTDVYIKGLTRDPVYQKVLNINPPNGDNVGEYEILLSGACGNSDLGSVNYQRSSQEMVVGKNQNVELSVTDPIIKSRA
jgi:hypothetical protein